MNKIKISLTALLLMAAFHAQSQTAASKNTTATTQAAKPAVSDHMKAFLAMFNGTSKAVDEALTTYEKEGLDRKDMDLYNLLEPKITDVEVKDKTEKYLIEVKSGATTRQFSIVWEEGKISGIQDLGFKFH